ncbi:23S rRNA pseudouridylate synthase B, partial [Parapusillimonas granuli]|nr:23S rRNA pseudouridylate synthase B [Parapusillimonas granuli]
GRPAGAPKAGGGRGEAKSRPGKTGGRGKAGAAGADDWQPRSASAHESQLGVLGGRRQR